MKRNNIIVLSVLFAAFVSIPIGLNAYMHRQQSIVSPSTATSPPSGAIPAGYIPVSKQFTAPDFSLEEAGSDKVVHLQDPHRTKPVLFSFWATWCGPCNEELPHLQALYKKYGNQIDFYGVNSSDAPADVVKFANDNQLTFPMLSDTNRDAATEYSVDAIPEMVLVSRTGNIVYIGSGFDPNMDTSLPPILDAVIAQNA